MIRIKKKTYGQNPHFISHLLKVLRKLYLHFEFFSKFQSQKPSKTSFFFTFSKKKFLLTGVSRILVEEDVIESLLRVFYHTITCFHLRLYFRLYRYFSAFLFSVLFFSFDRYSLSSSITCSSLIALLTYYSQSFHSHTTRYKFTNLLK